MQCIIRGHENFDVCGICMNIECQLESRAVCAKCLTSYHKLHLNSIILFNDILELKQKDLDYLKIFPQIEEMSKNIEEGAKNKNKYLEISKEIETNSSLIYDMMLNNFDNLNQQVRNILENHQKLNFHSLSEDLKKFDEFNLYEKTSSLINKTINVKDFENGLNETIIQNFKEIMNNKGNSKSSNSTFTEEEKVRKVSKDIAMMYNDLKNDLNVLFKKYINKSNRCEILLNGSLFNFIPTSYNKQCRIEDFTEGDFYKIKNKNFCLVGDRPLIGSVVRWKLIVDKPTSFSCCGFGIGSFDDPNLMTSQLSGNNNNILLCLCCNGPWSAKAMKVININYKLGQVLLTSEIKEIYFELNRNEEKFKIFDNNKMIHSEVSLNSLKYKENLTPILNCTSGVAFNFKIEQDF